MLVDLAQLPRRGRTASGRRHRRRPVPTSARGRGHRHLGERDVGVVVGELAGAERLRTRSPRRRRRCRRRATACPSRVRQFSLAVRWFGVVGVARVAHGRAHDRPEFPKRYVGVVARLARQAERPLADDVALDLVGARRRATGRSSTGAARCTRPCALASSPDSIPSAPRIDIDRSRERVRQHRQVELRRSTRRDRAVRRGGRGRAAR